MKTIKSVLPKAGMIFLIFTLLCGVIYTGVVTGIAQLILDVYKRQPQGSVPPFSHCSVSAKTSASSFLPHPFSPLNIYAWDTFPSFIALFRCCLLYTSITLNKRSYLIFNQLSV